MSLIAFLYDIVALFLLVVSAAGFLFFIPRVSALLSPMTVQAGVALACLLPLGLVVPVNLHHLAWSAMWTAAILQLVHALPIVLPQRYRSLRKQAFTLFQANVLRTNPDAGALIREIARQNPDVIVLCELTKDFARQLQPLSDDYPYYKAEPRDDSFGMGVFSRLPLASSDVVHLSDAGIPSIVAEVETPEGTVDLLCLHAPNPLKDWALRDLELNAAADWMAKRLLRPVVVTGDLNVTPFCWAFRRLLRISGFHHARLGRGHYPTWPVFLPDGPFRIAIDHTLASPSLEITAYRLAARIDSDHLPSFVQVSFVK